MALALYSEDRERARQHREKLLSARGDGGYYIEVGTGSNPTVVYSEWTCPRCWTTLKNVHATGKVTNHALYGCRNRPHPDQTELGDLLLDAEARNAGGSGE